MLARDLPPAAARAALRAGTLEKVRAGAYRHPPPAGSATEAAARDLALARIAAIGRQLKTPFWFSHESAALVWGCSVWKAPTGTHIIQTVRAHQHGDPQLTRHMMPLAPADRARRRGVPVTSLDRTVVDCLGGLPALDGLVIADSALRLGARRDAIANQLKTRTGSRGVVRARTVLDYADRRAESPWETFVRYILVSNGLPRPDLQIPIHTRRGWFWADLGWPEWKLLIEFDGFVKYAALAGGDPARAVFEEKRRQDAIEEEGWGVLRATAPDLTHPTTLITRVCRRLPPSVTSHLTPIPGLM